MSKETVSKFNEWTTWAGEHYPAARTADPDKKAEYVLTLAKGVMECLAMTIRDMRKLEEGAKADRQIVLPPWYRR
jgi:hypothetical protein